MRKRNCAREQGQWDRVTILKFPNFQWQKWHNNLAWRQSLVHSPAHTTKLRAPAITHLHHVLNVDGVGAAWHPWLLLPHNNSRNWFSRGLLTRFDWLSDPAQWTQCASAPAIYTLCLSLMQALISVYNKAGVVDLAKSLVGCGFKIISTGGTATSLTNEGVKVTQVWSTFRFYPIPVPLINQTLTYVHLFSFIRTLLIVVFILFFRVFFAMIGLCDFNN